MPQVSANGIQIEVECRGDPAHPPLLLIMGLGAQLTLWPVELVDALVARGFYVVRFDNRDIGLSQKFTHAGLPNFPMLVIKQKLGLRPKLAYHLTDMAADAVGVLDALGIARAHIVGASMGGMIAQLVAATWPDRVLSLTSIMSTTGNPALPPPGRAALKALTAPLPPGGGLDAYLALGPMRSAAIGSPGYPADLERQAKRLELEFHRAFHPTGAPRQYAAILADGDRRARLKAITAPTLVIHGEDDPLVTIEGGRDTAVAIAGARLVTYPGMGHDLPLALIDDMADQIAGVADQT
ncbi:MAG: alpha/beta hydrolase [Novosphingobium sp.]